MLIEINWNPDRYHLRNFGLVMLIALLVFGALGWWKFGEIEILFILSGAGLLVMFLSIFLPAAARPVYKAWMGIAFCMGTVMFPIFLAIVYYLVFVPTGLLLRLSGKDSMQRRKNDRTGYWVEIKHRTDKPSYERQF